MSSLHDNDQKEVIRFSIKLFSSICKLSYITLNLIEIKVLHNKQIVIGYCPPSSAAYFSWTSWSTGPPVPRIINFISARTQTNSPHKQIEICHMGFPPRFPLTWNCIINVIRPIETSHNSSLWRVNIICISLRAHCVR